MDTNTNANYRNLPSVDLLLKLAEAEQGAEVPRALVTERIREALASARNQIASGAEAPSANQLLQQALQQAEEHWQHSMQHVINASGIVVHTGLGRSLLSESAAKHVHETALRYVNLELDVEQNRRSSRQDHLLDQLKQITGAEDALVVNNNAAAVLLAVNTFALGKEVIISRGELVEIGGSFRLPDILTRSGAKLREVGTTNRTRISDYAQAISSETALILRCHPSNFKISGYTEQPSIAQLTQLSRESNIPLLDDLGSGALVDISSCGLEYEPTVQDSVRHSADMICFSGDKLLGSCQCGIVVGKQAFVSQLKTNPIARALRVDKLSIAALEATLRDYLWEDPFDCVPTLFALSRPLSQVQGAAGKCLQMLHDAGLGAISAEVVDTESEVGGGSMPGKLLGSAALALKSDAVSADYIGRQLRSGRRCVLARVHKDMCLVDFRTVLHDEVAVVVDKILEVDALIGENGGEL